MVTWSKTRAAGFSLFFFFFFLIFHDVLVSSTLTVPVNIFLLEEGETLLARGNENFRVPYENRTLYLPHTRSDVLTTEPSGLEF